MCFYNLSNNNKFKGYDDKRYSDYISSFSDLININDDILKNRLEK